MDGKQIIDGIATVGVIGTIVGYLPAIAAILGILWYLVQLYESKTIQSLIDRITDRKKAYLKGVKVGEKAAEEKVIAVVEEVAPVKIAEKVKEVIDAEKSTNP